MEKKEVIELVKACMEACLERYAVPGMMSVEDTAERLGISKDTVRDYIRKGELVGYEIGNRMMRVSVKSINDLLERVKTGKPETEKTEETDENGAATLARAEEPNPPSPEATEDKGAEQCAAIHPKSGKRCVLPAGHEGKHHCE